MEIKDSKEFRERAIEACEYDLNVYKEAIAKGKKINETDYREVIEEIKRLKDENSDISDIIEAVKAEIGE